MPWQGSAGKVRLKLTLMNCCRETSTFIWREASRRERLGFSRSCWDSSLSSAHRAPSVQRRA